MTSMKNLITSLALLLVSNASLAVITMGDRSCTRWVEAQKTPHSAYAMELKNWLFGYLSGYSVGMGSDFLQKADGPDTILRITKYCTSNPGKSMADGAKELASELERNR